MLDVPTMQTAANAALKEMPFLSGKLTQSEYSELINVMGLLVEDYDSNKALIDILFPVIEAYEANAPQFKEFNENIDKLDSGVALIRVLIDQHGLKLDDFKDELGGKSNVSMILNGKRSLTLSHISALSKRFNIPKVMFL